VQEQVAIAKPFCRLLRFKRFTDNLPMLTRMKDQPTVLVVAPLSGHHSTLLRETVRELLKDHKVYITDWTDARMVPVEAARSTSTTTSPTCRSSSTTSAKKST
jgi:poly(3-hydroxybutyrate) depolymerase